MPTLRHAVLAYPLAAVALALAGAPTALAATPEGGATAEDGTTAQSGASEETERSSGAVRVPAVLRRIAECESGGDPSAVSADGRHRGKYQFSRDTWRALGGVGDPAAASESTQDRLAVELYRREGTAPWPTCARAARRPA